MIKRLRFALACMVLVLLVSGCLDTTSSNDPATGSPGSTDAPTNGSPGTGTGVEEGPWQVNLTAQPFYTAAEGEPFNSLTSTGDSCAFFEFTVPANTNTLHVVLDGSATEPGTGYMTFMMRPKGGDWLLPGETLPLPPGAGNYYQELPSERTVMEQEDPVRGIWQVWVWPHGVVAQQTWNLDIVLEGTGTAPSRVAIEGDTDFFCD